LNLPLSRTARRFSVKRNCWKEEAPLQQSDPKNGVEEGKPCASLFSLEGKTFPHVFEEERQRRSSIRLTNMGKRGGSAVFPWGDREGHEIPCSASTHIHQGGGHIALMPEKEKRKKCCRINKTPASNPEGWRRLGGKKRVVPFPNQGKEGRLGLGGSTRTPKGKEASMPFSR